MEYRVAFFTGLGTVMAVISIWLFASPSESGIASQYPIDDLYASVDRLGERLDLVEDLAASVDERNASLRTVVGGLQAAALGEETHSNSVLSEAVSFLLDEQEKSAVAAVRDRDRWRLVAQYVLVAQAFNVGLGVLYNDPSYTDIVAEQVGQTVMFDPALAEIWTDTIANEMPVEVFERALQSRIYSALRAAIYPPASDVPGLAKPPLGATDPVAGY